MFSDLAHYFSGEQLDPVIRKSRHRGIKMKCLYVSLGLFIWMYLDTVYAGGVKFDWENKGGLWHRFNKKNGEQVSTLQSDKK